MTKGSGNEAAAALTLLASAYVVIGSQPASVSEGGGAKTPAACAGAPVVETAAALKSSGRVWISARRLTPSKAGVAAADDTGAADDAVGGSRMVARPRPWVG